MYLKGIEISGFKSFAHKTEFHFEDGITGIVGPNGSGKSNIADAMRWVLGEQSAKQLRSSSMQDVIFAGTETRRQQSYAYVNIIFDNSDHVLPIDYDEVTIGRRVYRSGESEYLINSSPCRLRDVQEMFYDTGIGKEGYSIIGQGQIDKILSGKPEERRELFDEAAGIVKFKKRKNTAVSRLLKEQESIVRINDILAELERQEGPLKNQAEKAREYLKLHDRLKILDVTDYVREFSQSAAKIEEAGKKLEACESQLNGFRGDLGRVKSRYTELGEAIESRSRQLEENRELLEEKKEAFRICQSEADRLENQIASAKERAELLKNQKAVSMTSYENSCAEHEADKQEFDKISRLIVNTTETGNQTDERIKSLGTRINKTGEKLIQLRSDEENLNRRKSGLLMDRQRIDTLSEQFDLQIVQLNGRLLSEQGLIEEAAEAIRKGKAEQKKSEEEIRLHKESMNANLQELKELYARGQNARQEADQKRSQAHQARAKFETLQNVAERYEGYGQSIRRLLEQKRQFPGIYGVLADLIKTEAKYEVAIETALGGALQNIVTDDERCAKACIEFLKKNRFGRATFLPVSTVKPKGNGIDPKAMTGPGVLGTADALISCEDRYKDIIRSLCGKILVVDTMDHALAVAARFRYSFRIVTLEGESLNTGGSISGGAFKNNSNLLGRNRELTELEKAWEKAREESRKADEAAASINKSYQEALTKKDVLLRQMQELQLKARSIELTLRQMRDQKDASLDEWNHLSGELEELKNKKNHLADDEAQAGQTATDLEKNLRSSREDIFRLEMLEKDLKDQYERINSEYVDIQLRLTSYGEQEKHLKETLEKSRLQMERDQEQIDRLTGQILEILKENTQKSERIRELEQEAEDGQAAIRAMQETISRDNEANEKDRKEQQRLFGEQERLSGEVSALEREFDRLTVQKEQLSENMERKAAYLFEEYEMTPSEAMVSKREDDISQTELKKEIASLKAKIRGLGSINTAAVEEYAELSERLTFLKEQHEDLVHARENLQLLIDQLDEDMKKQFSEKFVEIQKEFDKVFKELFGGGNGTLLLEEGDELLETGILIHVQPPGKKLQNMMQLSGGEKALTAISLLFAIQNLKPSPFCILDEIEAALDDANVDRYAKYLDKLKKNTQFIVITHRRGTMLIADQLYGITMQEKGISSLVSVDLTDADDM